ncbi:MAG: hypothetical protein NZ653_01945 [Anaerolineae bacterium]|nr:hypothetical protein [Anaerolineae bacterium]
MRFRLAFLLMGFTFTITQAIMVRELLVAFLGNELSIGLVLGCWLILEALGSLIMARFILRFSSPLLYPLLQVFLALALPLSLVLAFSVRTLLGAVPGQGLGIGVMSLTSFLILLPIGIVDGAMFTAASEAFTHSTRKGIPAVGEVYVLEAIGGIAGGVLFTSFFSSLLSPRTILFLVLLNLISALSLSVTAGRKASAVIGIFLLATLTLMLPGPGSAIERIIIGTQWKGYEVAFYGNSVYGNVTVIRLGEQYTLFSNGIPIVTTPFPDLNFVQDLAHLPLLFVQETKQCLIVSGGAGGLIRELLKYPWERIDYAELDPLLLRALRFIRTPLTEEELGNPAVEVHYLDGRFLIRKRARLEGSPPYNLVIINLPYPSTLQLNRFYTHEFFLLVREVLAKEGVLVVMAPGSLTYLSPAMRNLNLSLYATLKGAFPYVFPIPGDGVNLWLASEGIDFEKIGVEELVRRAQERPLQGTVVGERYLRLRFDPGKLSWFRRELEGGEASVNFDLKPLGLLHGLAYWNEVFSPAFAKYFETLLRLRFWHFVIFITPLALVFLSLLFLRKLKSTVLLPLVVASTGFGGMCYDLAVIFAFQIFYGYVYREIALLVAAFMAGLSFGGWFMSRRAERVGKWSKLVEVEGGLVALWFFFPLILVAIYRWGGEASVPLLLALNALGGFMVGIEFPLASKIYSERHRLSEAAGVMYGMDLAGAFLGSILFSVTLLPSLGLVGSCWLVGVIKLVSFTVVLLSRSLMNQQA